MFCEICGLDEIFESDIDPPANSYSYNPSTYATSIGNINHTIIICEFTNEKELIDKDSRRYT